MADSLAEQAKKRSAGRDILAALAVEGEVSVCDIVGRYNGSSFVALRVKFMKRASALGIGSVTIGRIIKRDHTTVLYHLNSEIRERKRLQRKRWESKNMRGIS